MLIFILIIVKIGSCINYGLVWNGEYVFFDKKR